jgi:hypothetical protein
MNLVPLNDIYFQGFGSNRHQIANGRLRMAVSSAGMSENGLMMNFVGPDITNAGGFSVELTVTEINSPTTQPQDRYAGFGVGLTRAEAAAGADIANPGSFRGRADLTNGLADCFVELDITGSVKLWCKGSLLETVPVGQTNGTLLASFKLGAGFAAGDAVEVNVFFNGELLDMNSADPAATSRTFTWEHDQANYLCLSARAISYCDMDNLVVRLLPLQSALSAQHAQANGVYGSDTDSEADVDGDGLDTSTEWLWGTNPALPDASLAAVQLSYDANAASFVLGHRRLRHEALLGVSYTARYSPDLAAPRASWSQVATTTRGTAPLPDHPQHEWVERVLPRTLTDPSPRLFLDLKANSTSPP